MSIDVSIIIVNYNTAKITAQCIVSILKQVRSCRIEIIVVDNASHDGSCEYLRKEFGDRIKLIESKENLGFGRANNLGEIDSKGKYLFFLNSDTILKNDPFPFFIKEYNRLDKVAFLGSYLTDGEGGPSNSGGKGYSVKGELMKAYGRWIGKGYKVEVEASDDVTEVEFVIGADMFVRKDIFEKLGGFDPKIFMYLEEVKLCKSAISAGYKNYVIPGPEIVHLEKQSSKSQFARVHYTASLMYCIKESKGLLTLKLFQLAYFISKMPLLLDLKNRKDNSEYIGAIYKYKKYLTK